MFNEEELMDEGNVNKIIRLYRAVGFNEYISLIESETFQILKGGVAVKYFGKNFTETLIFASKPINNGIVAIFEIGIDENDLLNIGDFINVDKFIFKSGTVEIQEEHLEEFNNAILYIKHIY